MEPGWIVGTSISLVVLLAGIVGIVTSKLKRQRNRWAGWFILFGCCAIASAFINYSLK